MSLTERLRKIKNNAGLTLSALALAGCATVSTTTKDVAVEFEEQAPICYSAEDRVINCDSISVHRDLIRQAVKINDTYFNQHQEDPRSEEWNQYKDLLTLANNGKLKVLVKISEDGVSFGFDGVSQIIDPNHPNFLQRPNGELDNQEAVLNYSIPFEGKPTRTNFVFSLARMEKPKNETTIEVEESQSGTLSFGGQYFFLVGQDDAAYGYNGIRNGLGVSGSFRFPGDTTYFGMEVITTFANGEKVYKLGPLNADNLVMNGSDINSSEVSGIGAGITFGKEDLFYDQLGLEGTIGMMGTNYEKTSNEESAYSINGKIIEGTEISDSITRSEIQIEGYLKLGVPFNYKGFALIPALYITTQPSVGLGIGITYGGTQNEE